MASSQQLITVSSHWAKKRQTIHAYTRLLPSEVPHHDCGACVWLPRRHVPSCCQVKLPLPRRESPTNKENNLLTSFTPRSARSGNKNGSRAVTRPAMPTDSPMSVHFRLWARETPLNVACCNAATARSRIAKSSGDARRLHVRSGTTLASQKVVREELARDWSLVTDLAPPPLAHLLSLWRAVQHQVRQEMEHSPTSWRHHRRLTAGTRCSL